MMGISSTQIIIILFYVFIAISIFAKDEYFKPKRGTYIFFVSALMLIVTFRPSTMADYIWYDNFFLSKYESRFELGFRVIRWIAQLFGNPVTTGLALTAGIALTLRSLFLYKYSNWLLGSVLVYFSYVLIMQDMITIRAGLASACLPFIVLARQQQKKIMLYSLLVLSLLFHQSAIIFWVVLFLSERKHERIIYPLMLLGSYALALNGYQMGKYMALVNVSSIQEHFDTFDSSDANIFNLIQMGHVAVCMAGWLFYKKLKLNDAHQINVTMLKLYTIALCAIVLLSDFLIIAYRFGELMLSVEIVLVPALMSAIFKRKIIRKIVLVIYASILFFIMMSDEALWNA